VLRGPRESRLRGPYQGAGDTMTGLSHTHRQRDLFELHRCSFGLIRQGESLNEETRTARFVASTSDIDSYGEVVEQYWDLKRFRANPVILFGHNRGGAGFWGDGLNTQAESLPVGHATSIDVVNGQLELDVKFADEKASPLAPLVWEGLKQGTIRSVSVGFMPGARSREERGEDEVVYHVGSAAEPNELYEVSIVVIPANASAVMKDAQLSGNHAGETPPRAAEGVRMDPEKKLADLEARLEARTAELATVTGQLQVVMAEFGAEREGHAATKVALDVAEKGRKAAELSGIEAEVNAVIGTKIAPAEVADQVELRTLWGKERWEKAIAARPDLKILEAVVPEDKTAKNTAASGRRVAKNLLAAANKAAEAGN
jgi:HK97 family phage prohead protease